jgi:hypothetical protein
LLAAGFAAAGGGLSGTALAGAGSVTSGSASVLSGNRVTAPVSVPADVCGNASALLGIASAGCQGGVAAASDLPATAGPSASGVASGSVSVGSGNTVSVPVSIPADVCGNAAAILGDSTAGCAGGANTVEENVRSAGTVIQGAVASADSAPGAAGPLAGLRPVSGLTSLSGVTSTGLSGVTSTGLSGVISTGRPGRTSGLGLGSGSSRTFNDTPSAGPSAGHANVPTAAQLVGLGAFAGLADLPSLAGLASMPALNGVTEGGIPMPGTALSAASAPGMNSDSYAALAVGALLAGASALKIADRRARDRKAGIGVAI